MGDRLARKVALVTGAASGIGRATAELFAAEGASVVLFDIDADGARRAAETIVSAGGRALALAGDVAVAADVETCAQAVIGRFGRLDIVFSNAGIPSLVPSILELSEGEWDRVLDVNLKGAFLVARATAPLLIAAGGGAMIFTGSDMSFVGDPLLPAYNASKGGLLLFMRSLALELIGHGIRVNAVCPGTTDTRLLELELRRAPDASRRAAENTTAPPIGRMASPQEIARVVLFLASDDASYLVGSAVVVDGGNTAR